MRKMIAAVLLISILCSFATGCSLWMQGEYNSVEPYQDQNRQDASDSLKVSSYDELLDVLKEMVRSGVGEDVITSSSLSQESAEESMEQAITHIMTADPFGAFAVSKITYDVGASGSDSQIAVNITYSKTQSEIIGIQTAKDMASVFSCIKQALDNCDTGVVIMAQSYSETDFAQYVNDYGNLCPDKVIEIPQVAVATYPNAGAQRLIELKFTYQTSREDLRSMQNEVADKFDSAVNYITDIDNTSNSAKQLYSWLMSRGDYTIAQSITPSYSLLCFTTGDSRAFANVFAAMCRRVGIDCEVISGMRDSEAWCWNKITLDGTDYYIDLIRCGETDGFRLRTHEEMVGYVWHDTAYPTSILTT